VKAARLVVVPATRGVRKRVVGIVDLLEAVGARSAVGGGGGDPVGMVLESGFLVGFADLGGGGGRWDVEDGVVVGERGR
jgi:hypothetical protein